MKDARLMFDTGSIADYRKFLAVKALPRYRFDGGIAVVPGQYAASLGVKIAPDADAKYVPHPECFDYQRDIAAMAIARRKFSVFADCGLGKTLILLEFAKHVAAIRAGARVLIVSPLMVVGQTVAEAKRFYGDEFPIQRVRAAELPAWLESGTGCAITNYEAIADGLPMRSLDGLILDESSMLKSHYGAWGTRLIELGRGVPYKMCLTGTPAPNDRIEYANHAVFMDAFPTVNSFLARFFVNRGQTDERWEIKAHAIGPFYRALSDWCIFLDKPSTYGWRDNASEIPPIHVHVHDVATTSEQRDAIMDTTGEMFVGEIGGIGQRAKIAQIAKGRHDGKQIATNKMDFICGLIASWPEESTLVWCRYNAEQDAVAAAIPGAASIDGSTPEAERERIVDAFKSGNVRVLVTKPKILGFGLNLQVATRQVFSTAQDSYEEFYQAVKRSNRIGSTRPLNVHIPVTEMERPMLQTVLRKANRVQCDAAEQAELFRKHNKRETSNASA